MVTDKDKKFGRREFLLSMVLVIITIAVYWQTVNHEFIGYDDDLYIFENPLVLDGLTFENIFRAFTSRHASNWHPLTWLSHMLDVQLFGVKPSMHHLMNIFFHVVNSVFLLFVLFRMSGGFWQSSFVAALFAIHPLHVESVAWAAERKDVLSAFFGVFTMWSYAKYVKKPGLAIYILTLFLFAAGLMAKPMLVTLPFVLLLLDFWPLGRFKIGPIGKTESAGTDISQIIRLIKEKIPFFVLVLCSCAATFIAQERWGALMPRELIPVSTRVSNAIVSYVAYIGKMFIPVNLSIFYPHPVNIPFWKVSGAILLLSALTVLFIKYRRQYPFLIVGWLWFTGTLVPVIGIVQVGSQAMADRYTYIPYIGLFIIIAWGTPLLFSGWLNKRNSIAVLTGIALFSIIALTACTWHQLGFWKNDITLFTRALAVTKNNALANNSLGSALAERGRAKEAMPYYKKAIRLNPKYTRAYYNLGLSFAREGKLKEAIKNYNEALKIEPDHFKTLNNMGVAMGRIGRLQAAVACYRRALSIKPDYEIARKNLKKTLDTMKQHGIEDKNEQGD